MLYYYIMSVLIETSVGDLVIDLYLREAPLACMNFLKLCKLKYYNFVPFHHIERNFIAQTGDPTSTGQGGSSVYGVLGGGSAYFTPERNASLKHQRRGTVSMSGKKNSVGSQFFITLADDLEYLDEKYAVFGQVAEGLDVLETINQSLCDEKHRPLMDILIRHTIVLDDPFSDPPGLVSPDRSPQLPKADQLLRIEAGNQSLDVVAIDDEGTRRAREARAQALTLEMIGDLPSADIKPPENILFVCKLNQATRQEDLETIFARFGKIMSCEVIRDSQTGDSLGYAFIEFERKESCEEAYFKMDNVLVDDRRIHVDFSQSVSRLHGRWVKERREKLDGGGLVKRGRYRDESGEKKERSYDMVFEERSAHRHRSSRHRNHHRSRRSRSPSYSRRK